MTPYGLTADLHAHAWSAFSKLGADGVNSRLTHILDEFTAHAKRAREQGARRLYIAGDVFHVRGAIRPSIFNPLRERLLAIAKELGLELIIMPGNHDLEGRETLRLGSAIEGLAGPGVTVTSETYISHEDRVVMVPWHATREGLLAAINAAADELLAARLSVADFDLILHTGINGVLIGMPDHGWAASELAALGFKRVFAGHYHNHKVFAFGETDGEVVSIGALTHQTWSDVDTEAGSLVVFEDRLEHRASTAPAFLDFDPERPLIDYRGNYVRIRGIELEEDEIRTLRDALEEIGAEGIVVHAVSKSKTATRPGVSASKAVTMETSVADYIKTSAPAHVEEVEREALDVLKEVA